MVLETHQPIALLADRKAETLLKWLQAHPSIEVLSRNRSKTYKSAMSEGAPEAIQVADRFHLVKNLSATLEPALGATAFPRYPLAALLSDAVYWIPTSYSFWTGGTRGLESRAS